MSGEQKKSGKSFQTDKVLMRPLPVGNACPKPLTQRGVLITVVWCNGGTFSQKAFRLTVPVRVRLRRQIESLRQNRKAQYKGKVGRVVRQLSAKE